ncbi:sodium/sugar symporter [Aliiglaciecola sp. LCG003]|uniref:sodium/sugar symporter n=1 Tax=Aliiglaciecola sp. LCG003 TaxID=3053655 RepID=UPI002573BB1E|nr:sodium/sugar symporter [Aliiglaciecola sp. LCG003]WJG10093.1 sodium/sugar symporter [Aliiglaciecola sp. LCG003]
MLLAPLDLAVLAIYVIALMSIAWWVSREKAGHEKDTNDYFLAGSSLPWWAIGASLVASNISAEQIIGMSGSGYAIGLAIASYEWMAAITLIIVGAWLLPIFLKRKIYTMPQFLQQRYDSRVRLTMALFWLSVYVFVNLTAVLWLGALAINTLTGLDLTASLVVLATLSLAYSLYGGLKAVALTDIIQVVLLVAGGLFLSYASLDLLGNGNGMFAGLDRLTSELPEKFNMILTPENEHYMSLPGISVLLGGLWVINLSYWGFNQYIIQRALAAKDLKEARKGIAFAAFLKLLMPVLVVLPGIAAVLLLPPLDRPDQAYPQLMGLMPVGLKGLIFAALVAAILSSLASMTNSISTIFTMDLYAHARPNKSQHHYVKVGRITSVSALVIALVTAQPLLGDSEQAFQFIQEFTGFFTPGIVVLFLLGMFWKKATANGALIAAVGSAVLSLAAKMWLPEVPFMDRVGYVFLSCLALAVVVSLLESKGKDHANAISLDDIDFSTDGSYRLSAVIVIVILICLYSAWW